MSIGVPDPDAVAAAVGALQPGFSGDALVRQQTREIGLRLSEVREAAEFAHDRAVTLAAGLANGSATEDAVVAALGERDRLRLLQEAYEIAQAVQREDPAIRGRR